MTVHLIHKFICFSSVTLSPLDKVTTKTKNIISVIANVHTPTELLITHFTGQVHMGFISRTD